MLLLQQLVKISTCNPVLQQTIFANSLINLQGRPDSFFKTDYLNKLLNLQLKELLWTRSNSTFSTDKLFKWSVFIISYTSTLYDIFKYTFGERINSKYTIKSPVLDIQYLADQIRKDSIMQYIQHLADFKAPLLLQHEYKKLIKDSINIFNAFLLTVAGLLFNHLIYSFSNANKNIEVLGEAAKYIYIIYYPNITPIPLLMCIIVGV